MPWQTGQVILIYRRDKTGGELRSINDLFDPKFKGKVTFLTEMRDSVGSVLLGDGIEPEKATRTRRWPRSRSSRRRRRTARSGVSPATSTGLRLEGDSTAVLGWSGDAVAGPDNENIAYSQPEEGFMIFTDSMQIPVGAPHAFTAQKMIDFVYRPEIQAALTEYIQYVPPVKGAREICEKRAQVAQSELVFPDLSRATA